MTDKTEAMENLIAQDADLIDVETKAAQEAGQPWLWTYDAHLKGKPNGD